MPRASISRLDAIYPQDAPTSAGEKDKRFKRLSGLSDRFSDECHDILVRSGSLRPQLQAKVIHFTDRALRSVYDIFRRFNFWVSLVFSVERPRLHSPVVDLRKGITFMNRTIPRSKRAFDIVVGSTMILFLLPVLLVLIVGIALLEGRPIFYISQRRINSGPPEPVIKFRTMQRDADRIANRDTVQVSTTRFLNLPITSPLYTPIGRFIERLMLTEMPQLLHVLQGRMSLVGNRPLPNNVVTSLREEFSNVEQRFVAPSGLTGPVQLVGRDCLSDAQRLEIEIGYCHAVCYHYSVLLDFNILALTIIGGFLPRARLTPEQALAIVSRDRRHSVRRPDKEKRSRQVQEPDQQFRGTDVREEGIRNR